MGKLIGEAYKQYWIARAAKTMSYVGYFKHNAADVQAQADFFWGYLQKRLPGVAGVHAVAELGCGWGRMLSRLAEAYPAAVMLGIDIVPKALEHGRKQFPKLTFVLADHYPEKLPQVDLLVTCTCLQHITDPVVWAQVVASIHRGVRPGGTLLMLENATPGSAQHMADRRLPDYVMAFDGFTFSPTELIYDRDGQSHFVLSGRRD
jgi:SAM-dependent methyltransferase